MRTRKLETKEFRKILRKLRINFPTGRNVIVRRRPMTKLDGKVESSGNEFFLTINSTQSRTVQLDSLVHEWAHIIVIERMEDWTHSQLWGVKYAEIYTCWENGFQKER